MPKVSRSSRAVALRRRPLRKSLEQLARVIKDDDEFVDHITAVSARYRAAYIQDSKDSQAVLKQNLRAFRRHAEPMVEWFVRALSPRQAGVEAQALKQLQSGVPGQEVAVHAWLASAVRAATEILERPSRSIEPTAPRVTAEALLGTFDHHKLKTTLGSARKPGASVQLLREIAKAAGDDLAIEAARDALLNARSK